MITSKSENRTPITRVVEVPEEGFSTLVELYREKRISLVQTFVNGKTSYYADLIGGFPMSWKINARDYGILKRR